MSEFTAANPLRVLIVDDHFVVRSGLATSLGLDDTIKVVGEAERGEEVVAVYRKCRPDAVLMDLQLRGLGGVAATAALCEHDPEARVLIFSTFARIDEIQDALDSGALGYVQKNASRDELLAALRTVARGVRHIQPDLAKRLTALRLGPAITPREREILTFVATGRANKEIGVALHISENTVKRHISHILEKMNVNDRAEASVEAIRRGLVKISE